MTTSYNEARANSPCSDDHKLGTLLDYFLMPENTGVGLKHIINWAVAENVDALEVHLIKSKKLLKEASKTQTKLLNYMVKQKLTLEKSHFSKPPHDETSKALSQTTKQLDGVETTIAKHTMDIAHIKALLEDCESVDEESSSSGIPAPQSSSQEPGSGDPPAATPWGQEDEEEHDIKMRDVENDPNPPPPSEQDDNPPPVPATQTNPPPEDNEDDSGSDQDVIVKDNRIVVEIGGATLITPADNRLLDQDDQEGMGAETPSGVITELLSQMNMDLPATPLVASDTTGEGQDA